MEELNKLKVFPTIYMGSKTPREDKSVYTIKINQPREKDAL